MSRWEKLLAKTRNSRRAVAFRDLEKLLEWHGFELKRVKGSHHMYVRGQHRITVVWRKPHVHPDAVTEALDMIDEILAEE